LVPKAVTHSRYTVDRFHVCESCTAAAPDPAHAKDEVTPLREALRASDFAQVLAALHPRTAPREISDPQAPVRAALRYLENRPAQIDTASALAHDLPVGSSLNESGHKHVLKAPLKKSGAWWEEAHGHARCQLRTLRANHLWNKYWSNNYRLYFRLHPVKREIVVFP